MNALKAQYGLQLVQRAKTCMQRWKGAPLELSPSNIGAFLYLDRTQGRVTRQSLEEFLASKKASLWAQRVRR